MNLEQMFNVLGNKVVPMMFANFAEMTNNLGALADTMSRTLRDATDPLLPDHLLRERVIEASQIARSEMASVEALSQRVMNIGKAWEDMMRSWSGSDGAANVTESDPLPGGATPQTAPPGPP